MQTLGVVLMVALLTVGGWVPLAFAGSKKRVTPKAPVPETGQTACWDASGMPMLCEGTGQDGEIRAGVSWPVPRFTDRGNGTVRDNLTGLIWLKNASCDELGPLMRGDAIWRDALELANTLEDGICGLTDGSVAGTWRLPNIKELQSLIDFGQFNPALPAGHPFSDVWLAIYWSSTTVAGNELSAWVIFPQDGTIIHGNKEQSANFVWPVRGGE
jgi:hypothetical protein